MQRDELAELRDANESLRMNLARVTAERNVCLRSGQEYAEEASRLRLRLASLKNALTNAYLIAPEIVSEGVARELIHGTW